MSKLADRFRGFLPVVVDVETGGFNPATDALLEVAAMGEENEWQVVAREAAAETPIAKLWIEGTDGGGGVRVRAVEG